MWKRPVAVKISEVNRGTQDMFLLARRSYAMASNDMYSVLSNGRYQFAHFRSRYAKEERRQPLGMKGITQVYNSPQQLATYHQFRRSTQVTRPELPSPNPMG